MVNKYFKPKSLTWWASFVPVLVGVFIAAVDLHGLVVVVGFLNTITGDIKPAVLINMGLVGIGARGAMEKNK